MQERSPEERNQYFEELTRNLNQEGFTAGNETDGLLAVAVEGWRLCTVTGSGTLHYWQEDIGGDYRLLADFNGTILAGHSTRYGVEFITWERGADRSSLYHGHFYGPGSGLDGYLSAKRDFATRSGLIPRSALFAPEQMVEIYLCCDALLAEPAEPVTDERQERLQSIMDQVERGLWLHIAAENRPRFYFCTKRKDGTCIDTLYQGPWWHIGLKERALRMVRQSDAFHFAGRLHVIRMLDVTNRNGGVMEEEKYQAVDGKQEALDLIKSQSGTVTPYGVVYQNGMELEPIYQGRQFPPYIDDVYPLMLEVTPKQGGAPVYLNLPSSVEQIKRNLLRGGIADLDDVVLSVEMGGL